MRTRLALLLSGTALAAAGTVGFAAPALAVCDAYSTTCVEPTQPVRTPEPTKTPTVTRTPDVETEVLNRTTVRETPSTLPFTGGELVLLSTAGIAAVAGGAALVVAGRRRRAEQPGE